MRLLQVVAVLALAPNVAPLFCLVGFMAIADIGLKVSTAFIFAIAFGIRDVCWGASYAIAFWGILTMLLALAVIPKWGSVSARRHRGPGSGGRDGQAAR